MDVVSLSEDVILTSEDEDYLENLTMILITKEIYARAAKASIANILVDHDTTGQRARVEAFLEHLRTDDDEWNTRYREIAREFTELMASARPRSRTLEICRAGLDAIHDLLKYRLPIEPNTIHGSGSQTVLVAKDAFVLCQSFDTLYTHSVSGTRAPDLDYRFGLLTKSPQHHEKEFSDAQEFTLWGQKACDAVSEMRNNGVLETSTASLAGYTLTEPNLVGLLAHKIFVVLGCDHPLSPTQSLLKIPGVTVLGIPSHQRGLQQVLRYATYNTPDDTTFVYPTSSNNASGDDNNLILSRGPHVAQWILEQTKELLSQSEKFPDAELVLVPMPLPVRHNRIGPGEAAIRWEASSDLIVQRVLRARSDSIRCSVWSYQSSTTCMVVPAASTTKSTELLQQRPAHEPWLHKLSMGTILTPVVEEDEKAAPPIPTAEESSWHADPESPPEPKPRVKPVSNHDYSIVNGILSLEGPHHMLAQHIRMWRAMVTNFPNEYHRYFEEEDSDDEDEDDYDSSKNIHVFAPYVPLLTPDLVSSGNAHVLDPLHVFDAGSASSLLCAVGLAGLADPIVNRPMPIFEEASPRYNIEATTPFAMFWYGSVHGGIWNCPYTLESASGAVGYVLGKVYEYYYHYYSNDNETGESSKDDTTKTVDLVPNSVAIDEDMPPMVQQRLQMIANP